MHIKRILCNGLKIKIFIARDGSNITGITKKYICRIWIMIDVIKMTESPTPPVPLTL